MKTSAIIVAAGGGVRLGAIEPKAFVRIAGRTMLSYSLRAISQVAAISEIVIAIPPGFEAAARAEVTAAGIQLPVKITAGGAQRQDSVRIALELTSAESEIVIVHDAARPLATASIFAACIDRASRRGAAIAATPVTDTLKRVADSAVVATVPRAGLWQAQTPQAFRRELLVSAHQRALTEQIVATDDADLVERIGAQVEVVECPAANLKVTTRDDLAIAHALLSAR